MNTQEIKELVAKKIAGQGTMVDVGGGLPAILNAIADALDEIAGDIPAAQIQSDWEQDDSSKVDFIKNKPTIPAAQVQSDWNQADSEEPDFIKNKPTIPAAQVKVYDGSFDTTNNVYQIPGQYAAQIAEDFLSGKVVIIKTNNPTRATVIVLTDDDYFFVPVYASGNVTIKQVSIV